MDLKREISSCLKVEQLGVSFLKQYRRLPRRVPSILALVSHLWGEYLPSVVSSLPSFWLCSASRLRTHLARHGGR